MRSGGNITTGEIDTTPTGGVEGGPVILSAAGNITTGEINSSSVGQSGNVINLSAGGNIQTGELNTVSDGGFPGNSGAVSLNAPNGSITVAVINTFKGGIPQDQPGGSRQPGDGGAVSLNALGDIVINNDLDSGNGGIGRAGGINFASQQGEIRIGGRLFARADQGTGGTIVLRSAGNLSLNSVSTAGALGGGEINLNSAGAINIAGDISSGPNLPAASTIQNPTGSAGNVALSADGNITVGGLVNASVPPNYLAGNGGNITLTSRTGTITTRDRLDAGTTRGNGGSIVLRAQQDINTAGLVSAVVNNGAGDAGDIFLTSLEGAINVGVSFQGNAGGLFPLSARSENGNAGNIGLEAATGIAIAPTNSDAVVDLAAIGTAGDGGNLTLHTNRGNIIVGATISTAASNGNGGFVTLDPPDLIQVSTINTQGGQNGVGGNVDITAGLFRATGTFTDQNGIAASISAAGGAAGGSVIIRHNGGLSATPFVVGNASINGTAAAITTGTDNSILPQQTFPGIYRQGNPPNDIQILTQEPNNPLFYPPISNLEAEAFIPAGSLDERVFEIERKFTGQFDRAVGQASTPIKNLEQIQRELAAIERETGIKTAIIYGVFVTQTSPQLSESDGSNKANPFVKITQQTRTWLELVLVTARNKPIFAPIRVTQPEVLQVAAAFTTAIKRGARDDQDNTYLPLGQSLYRWLVTPLKPELEQRGIQNLVFILDEGLRSLPLTALHNGQSYIIEQYSVGLVPSHSLTDSRYSNISRTEVLAMGASQFPAVGGLNREPSLPYASIEINTITRQLWQGEAFLNRDFTVAQLETQRRQKQYGIVHLSTHATFDTENPKDSYIRFYSERLSFEQFKTFDWNQPPIELLVLSACETALGGPEAELGFAGLTVQTGVKSALASLWPVNDEATLVLMTKFYRRLSSSPIKAEGLRQAQLEMLRQQNPQQLRSLLEDLGQQTIPLSDLIAEIQGKRFPHPYYWAGFTIVGNPW
ncbi:CHAT domain-containing protein (plasmid) [Kovacikia minuta CCNUW1]|uniref:CHAT domain-containing protein n=1 Tax=Kovacikia minuta TaxID=2931930 RepID=UPI001CC979A1|nr:CHAT domain-containing protein [Kovacikia minuta]UBF30271.1 CHAT domain-containing protein [Kovacikia minuta CCNUW1]